MRSRFLWGVIAVLAGLAHVPAFAQDGVAQPLAPPDVLDLQMGAPAAAQPRPFREFACGTDGGPPAQLLAGFEDFGACPVEAATGLHEVTFRYDDEMEYYALAMSLTPVAQRYAGTRFGTFPVIVSALFDDGGTMRGYRVVTDDRVPVRERRSAYTMSILAKSRIVGDWTCVQLPLQEGETPVGRNAIKEDCTGVAPNGDKLTLKTRFFHRRGQSQIDPHSGEVREGLYESTARLEVFDADWSGK